jgi:hypothetical protein
LLSSRISEINTKFEKISYGFSSCLCSMFTCVLGETDTKIGLSMSVLLGDKTGNSGEGTGNGWEKKGKLQDALEA